MKGGRRRRVRKRGKIQKKGEEKRGEEGVFGQVESFIWGLVRQS